MTLAVSNNNFSLISNPVKNPISPHLKHEPIKNTYKRGSLPHPLLFGSELHGVVFPIHKFLAVSHLSYSKR